MHKIYIAGPEVFEKNSLEIGEKYKEICRKYNCEGMYPLDNCCSTATEIYFGNTNLIDKADAVIANGNEFRGEMDVGTAFEIGYAVAKGKPVYIYMNDTRSLIEKYGTEDAEGRYYEDFNRPLNLMLAESSMIVKGNFEDAVITFIDD